MIVPKVSAVRADNTHRLIPYRYSDRGRPVLDRIAADDGELNDLLELEGATNDRLLGESGKLPGMRRLSLRLHRRKWPFTERWSCRKSPGRKKRYRLISTISPISGRNSMTF